MHSYDSEQMADISDLSKLATEVSKRGLGVPAIFILELHKPLTTVAHGALSIGAPLLIPLFGPKLVQSALTLLSSRKNVEQLIQLIEAQQDQVKNRLV